jgi:hypothetical protein
MIERANQQGAGVMAEDDSAAAGEGAAAPSGEDADQAQTVEIPVSAIGGQKVNPGDVIRLKVISVDENNGVINATYDHAPEEVPGTPPRPKGSEGMAMAAGDAVGKNNAAYTN